MTGLLDKLSALPQLQELLAALHSSAVTCCAAVTGLSPVHRAMFSAALAAETKRPLLLLCADEKDVQRQAADIRVLLGVEPVCLPERELQLRPAAYSRQWENARLSALYRMAFSQHKQIEVGPGDRVIISASAIPGNENTVSRVINELFRKGVEVIYDRADMLHVSGHACQEELKIIHALTKPKYFIPVHGEQRMLQIHLSHPRILHCHTRVLVNNKNIVVFH